MAKDFYPELARLLRTAGWRWIDGGKGSHEKWERPAGAKGQPRRVIIVPRSKSRHTANEVLKQAGLPKAF